MVLCLQPNSKILVSTTVNLVIYALSAFNVGFGKYEEFTSLSPYKCANSQW